MRTYFILMMTKELFIELNPSRTEVLVSQHGHTSHIVEVLIFLLNDFLFLGINQANLANSKDKIEMVYQNCKIS